MKNPREKLNSEIAAFEKAADAAQAARECLIGDRDRLQAEVVKHSVTWGQSRVAMAYGQATDIANAIHERDLELRSLARKIQLRRDKLSDLDKKEARVGR